MRELPRKAQLFLALAYSLGLLVSVRVLCALLVHQPVPGTHRWELPMFLGMAALAGGKKVSLLNSKSEAGQGNMSLLFPVAFAAMLHLGPVPAVFVVTLGSLSAGVYPKRLPLHQLFFNVALGMVQIYCAAQLYHWMNGGTLRLSLLSSFPAIVAACFVYYAINTGSVALIIALCTGQNPVALWRQTFLWMAPSYFAGGGISALALFIFGSRVGVAVVFILPVAYLIYQSYAIYIGRAEEKQQHINSLQENQQHLADLYLATIKSLALAIDAKDQYTHQHILRVQRYAVATAVEMGLEGNELEGLNTGALLHDIGKLGVPEYVLLKPGRLTDDEFAKIKKHPEIGAAILGPVDFPWPVLPVVKSHHEKWDGTGYPEGLAGEAIPRTARVLAVADVYDALTSSRSYRKAWSHERAMDVIIQDAGTHFDPVVVHAFVNVIGGVLAQIAQEEESRGDTPDEAGDGDGTRSSEEAALAINRASSELWALYEVTQTLSSSLGLQETLEILSRKMEAILPNTACLFLLSDAPPEGGDIVSLAVRTAVGLNVEFFLGGRTIGTASRSLRVARSRQTHLGEFDMDDLLPSSSASAQWTPLKSALIVPIVHQGETLGTINLYHPQASAFSSHDQQLLETIAERAAMALYNGLLFDRTRNRALTDPLTGLYNVRYLTEQVEARCRSEQAADEPFALLCLDLDSFKPINDNFGHQKGDKVLQDLSALFQASVRETDIVARYGGDEFLIVLQGAGRQEAESMAQQIEQAVVNYDSGLFHERLGILRLGVSVGYGCFPRDGQDCAALLSVADLDMYRSKTERKLGSLASRNSALAGDLAVDLSLPPEISRAA